MKTIFILILIFEPSMLLKYNGFIDHIEYGSLEACESAKAKVKDEVSVAAICTEKEIR